MRALLKTSPRETARNGRSTRLHVVFSLLAGLVCQAAVRGQDQAAAAPPQPRIVQSYIYGYAPVTLQATRAVQTAVPDATMPGRAPINQFAYRNTLATPDERLVVRPNADTLYATAWLDLAREPMILHVPDTAGRYYLIPMLDAYSNEFASIGSRTTGDGEGNYAIVGPRWNGFMPENVTGVIHSPTDTVWLLGRTLVNGESDLAAAAGVASQYKLVPLSAYPGFLATGIYEPPTNVPVTPPNPDFIGEPISSSAGFSKPEFFDVLARDALENPAPREQFAQASALVLYGFFNQNQLTAELVSEAGSAALHEILSTGIHENGWSFNPNIGSYGTDYLLRAAVARFGLGANGPADAIYADAVKDSANIPLVGTNSYVIHFAPGQTPPARGFWSLTVYDADGFLVRNPINRYDVGSQTGLVSNSDGSVDIFLQNTAPHTLPTNWLPTPAAPFTLTLRIYWPDQSVLGGAWIPPAVRSMNAPLP
ncbi:MAG: hypothetical protein JWO52_7247 [Gammaproteobacteria bacterium]|jgi:hypothetical protein|nr:hypothetical protein [Gammaproteobacteria bacterium]